MAALYKVSLFTPRTYSPKTEPGAVVARAPKANSKTEPGAVVASLFGGSRSSSGGSSSSCSSGGTIA